MLKKREYDTPCHLFMQGFVRAAAGGFVRSKKTTQQQNPRNTPLDGRSVHAARQHFRWHDNATGPGGLKTVPHKHPVLIPLGRH